MYLYSRKYSTYCKVYETGINVFLRCVTQHFRKLGFMVILPPLHQKLSERGVRINIDKDIKFIILVHPVVIKFSQKCGS